jgi:GntR family transcriptional regulator/MocR family aminotransferase
MTKRGKSLVLTTISVDRSSRTPLYFQLYRELREAIETGRFRAKTQLPSSRALAQDLGLSRKTVVDAFEQLAAEGYLESTVGSGTYVTGALPEVMPASQLKQGKTDDSGVTRRPFSPRGKKIAAASPFFPAVKAMPFRHGLPALDAFPLKLWTQLAGKRLRGLSRELLGYGDSKGYRPLREAIAWYLGTARAVRCEPEQVVVVAGSQQAIYLTALVLLDKGDSVWIEDPGYLGARGAFHIAGAHLIPVPVDEQGLRVSEGLRLDPNARLVYVTPSNQYPLTVTMSLSRRLELLEWARNSGAWIVEDDYDSEFRYNSRPIASLQGLDRYGRVIYLGTFSKLLAPTLRIGYFVLPPDLVDVFSVASSLISRHPPGLEQIVLTDFIELGHLARHIRRMRTLYMERQADFIDSARSELGGLLEITAPDAGTHVVAKLPRRVDARVAARSAELHGVESRPLPNYFLNGSGPSGLILGYGAFTKRQTRAGMQKLAVAFGQRERLL